MTVYSPTLADRLAVSSAQGLNYVVAPDQAVWIAMDQDRAHPCKSRKTRQLKLHWISLPKASPDDNPMETIFSEIQLMILGVLL